MSTTIERTNLPRTPAELARQHKMNPRRLRTILQSLHRQHGNILSRVGHRWFVSMPNLMKAWPGFGKSVPAEEDVEEIRELQDEAAREIRVLARQLADVRKRLETLELRRTPAPPASLRRRVSA